MARLPWVIRPAKASECNSSVMSESRTDMSTTRAQHATVIDQCRDMALIFSNARLAELFDSAGPALLDFAERAENNTLQGRFFEAMGLIQRRRSDIDRQFQQEITDGFDNFGKVTQRSRKVAIDSDAFVNTELTLVEPDEMEESLAAENLVIKANASYSYELYALGQRLAMVNDGGKLKDFEIPAGPHHLVRAFRRSLTVLDVEVRIKVILYALFDKFVIQQAKSLYDEINGSLKAAGILPNLRPVHLRQDQQDVHAERRQPREGGRRTDARDSPGSLGDDRHGPDLGAELFDVILDLMANRRSGHSGADTRGAGRGKPANLADGAAESRRLVSAIDRLQSQKTTESVSAMLSRPGEIPNLEVDTLFNEKVKQTLGQEREQILAQIDPEKLSPMDADVIDLIGMLFEYMLNEPLLPNLAKALLSHLHTPCLKVALIDRRLLVDPQHPSRRLLDQLVEAGSLWVDESNPLRGIFPAMQQVVDRVLREFSVDVSLFEELLQDFEQAMAEHRRRADTMEQRARETARGREKLKLAKRRAGHQIQLLIKDHQLPQPVVTFLTKTWLDQLVFILLRDRHGELGEAWRQAVKTGEDLIALFDPPKGPAEQRARREAVSDLQQRISEAVKKTGTYAHAALEPLFSLLGRPETFEKKSLEGVISEPIGSAAPPPPEVVSAGEGEFTEKEKEVIARLRKMKLGTWFELTSTTGGAPRRIKLSWLSPVTATCMFVDRSGMQAEIKTLHELAQEILTGRATVIPRPRHPFIERALYFIKKMLQGG